VLGDDGGHPGRYADLLTDHGEDLVVGVAVVLQQPLGKGLAALLLSAVCLGAAGELLLDIRLDARLTQDGESSGHGRAGNPISPNAQKVSILVGMASV
jgi:hypothetical protein